MWVVIIFVDGYEGGSFLVIRGVVGWMLGM